MVGRANGLEWMQPGQLVVRCLKLTSMNSSIRRWIQGDLPTIQRLLLETWLDAYGSFIPREDLVGYLHAQYSQPKLEGLFAD